MEESDTGRGGELSREGEAEVTDITVLYVDRDPDAWDDLSSFVGEVDDIGIERVRDTERARSLLGDIDVVVVDETVLDGAEDPLLATATPTVLYTEADPWNIDDRILGAANSLVEKDISASERYLVEKLRGMVTGLSQREEASVDALARLSRDIGDDAGLYLLDADGTIRWESESLAALFDIDGPGDSAVGTGESRGGLAANSSCKPAILWTVPSETDWRPSSR